MKISIIMPVYNVERYISNAIDSVLKQTYENFELIIVNDGTTDDSASIAQKYVLQDSRVSLIHKKNGGLSDARNAGLSHVKGDYIIFMDSDDLWSLDLLQNVVDFNDIHGWLDMVIFGYYADFQNSDGKTINLSPFTEKSKVINVNSQNVEIENIQILGYAWNKMYRASFIKKNKLRFQKGISYVEDVIFNAEAFRLAKDVGFFDKPLYYYAQRPQETLGRKYYDNIENLDKVATESFCTILRQLHVPAIEVDKFYIRNTYARAKWTVRIIAKTTKLTGEEKNRKIKGILLSLDNIIDSPHLSKDVINRLYRYLVSKRLVGSIITLENLRK